jgi:TldD protein
VSKDELQAALKQSTADYCEIRLEKSERTTIRFQGKELDTVSQSVDVGGCVRALHNGAWGFVSFNDTTDLAGKVKAASEQAKLLAEVAPGKNALAPVPVTEDAVRATPCHDPRQVTLEDKVKLLQHYNDIILGYDPAIAMSNIYYFDQATEITFANTEGTHIVQGKVDLGCNISAVATRDGQTVNNFLGTGTTDNYEVVMGLDNRIKEMCRLAVELLSAPTVVGGVYPVILDPELAGVFIHEAFGHLSEGDNVYENPELAKVMTLGTRFGSDKLNVYDSGLEAGHRGTLRYDDEGTPTEQTYLIKNGVLVGRLHSRETAGKMGEKPTGNARAINYRFPPICRMRTTCIEGGSDSFEDMLQGIKLGVYAVGAYGGETNGEQFTFVARYGQMIRNGKLAEVVKDVALSGNVFTTLKNIDRFGDDFEVGDSAGGCGKNGQSPLPTSEGSPHIRIQNVVIGGAKE